MVQEECVQPPVKKPMAFSLDLNKAKNIKEQEMNDNSQDADKQEPVKKLPMPVLNLPNEQ